MSDDDEFHFQFTERGVLTIVKCITMLFALLIAGAIAINVAGRLQPQCPTTAEAP